jgi:hypothetical protein
MIEKEYRIAVFKTIVANDLSANFSNYFLLDYKPIFNGYICINPEFAPKMPDYLKKYISEIKGNETYFYLSHGNNTEKKKLELIDDTDVNLMGVSNVYFNYKFESFKHAKNLLSIPQAIASAQEYVFSIYSPIGDEEFEKNISFLSPMAAMEYLQYKYENIDYLFGEKIPIRRDDFIRLEAIMIDQEEGQHLLEYSELALKIHPKSPLGNYYIGQFYEIIKEYTLALRAYKRGYGKIPEGSPKSDAFYMNIQRILTLQKLEREAINNPKDDTESIEEVPTKTKEIDSTATE